MEGNPRGIVSTASRGIMDPGLGRSIQSTRMPIYPDFHDAVSMGMIQGKVPWSKMGFSPTINTSESDLWAAAGVYTFPASAAGKDVVSSDNTQDIGTVIKSGTSTGGSTTTIEDSGADFTAATAVEVGDCVILDKSGTTPEWGYVTGVTANTLTIAGGFSSEGTGASRDYSVVDYSAYTGAHAVRVEYLTGSFISRSEIVILNGTTVVHTVNADMFRINSFRVIAAGSGNKPVGNLVIRDLAGTPNYSYISAGFTRARNNMYTVPAGKTLYVIEWNVGWSTPNDTKVQTARIYARTNMEPSTGFITRNIFYPYTETIISNSQVSIQFPIPTKVKSTVDVKVSGLAFTGGSGAASSILRGWLE